MNFEIRSDGGDDKMEILKCSSDFFSLDNLTLFNMRIHCDIITRLDHSSRAYKFETFSKYCQTLDKTIITV